MQMKRAQATPMERRPLCFPNTLEREVHNLYFTLDDGGLIYSICYCLVSCTTHPSHGQSPSNSVQPTLQQQCSWKCKSVLSCITSLHWGILHHAIVFFDVRNDIDDVHCEQSCALASSPLLTPNEPPVMWRLVYHYTSHNLSQTAKKWTGKWMYCVQRKPEKVRRMCLGISSLPSNLMLRGFYSCVSSRKSSWCKPCHTSCTGTSLHRG